MEVLAQMLMKPRRDDDKAEKVWNEVHTSVRGEWIVRNFVFFADILEANWSYHFSCKVNDLINEAKLASGRKVFYNTKGYSLKNVNRHFKLCNLEQKVFIYADTNDDLDKSIINFLAYPVSLTTICPNIEGSEIIRNVGYLE